MENQLLKTIPVEIAMEYYTDADRRGRTAGAVLERKRIEAILKKAGHYEALLAIKRQDATDRV